MQAVKRSSLHSMIKQRKYSADELDKLKSETTKGYNNEKRQRITVRAVASVDYAAESKYLFEEMSKMKISMK
ncbi:hypothetical protein KY285_017754 [Solanum tuberosum]|nr:hypothetical protein KY285_017754 [Solanum tuberosum]